MPIESMSPLRTCATCGAEVVGDHPTGWLCQDAVNIGDPLNFGLRKATEADVQPETWVCSSTCAQVFATASRISSVFGIEGMRRGAGGPGAEPTKEAHALTQPFNAKTAEGVIRSVERTRDTALARVAELECQLAEARQPRIPSVADLAMLDAQLVAIAKGDESKIASVTAARALVRAAHETVDRLFVGVLWDTANLFARLAAGESARIPASGIASVESIDRRIQTDNPEDV